MQVADTVGEEVVLVGVILLVPGPLELSFSISSTCDFQGDSWEIYAIFC